MTKRLAAAAIALAITFPAGAQYYGFGKNKVRYDTFHWKIYPTTHFRISYYDRVEPDLKKIASFAESAYDELARKLNYQITEPVPLITFATHTEFEQTNVINDYIPEGVGAFATPSRNRIVLPVDLSDTELQTLIQHELVHIFQYEILFQGKLGKALTSRAPQWFMEGMASYFANDEDARARAVMRDGVMSDIVPSVESQAIGGYYAYRYGHKVFEFIESEWGVEGLRDFIFEFRNSMGMSVAKAIKRAFELEVEEFDARFRTWLRKHYAGFSTERGDAREFGLVFRPGREGQETLETSPVASPSGDIVAAYSTVKDDIDIVLIGVPNRKLFRNLSSGNTTKYQYFIAQGLSVGPDRGRDLSYSPDGNQIAVFARRERGRELLLINTINGAIDQAIPIKPDQAMEPAFAPDGKTIVFRAFAGGKADLYQLDLATKQLSNLTDDDAFDGDPVFTPDGKHVVYASISTEFAKLYELSLEDRKQRRQLTFGPGNDEGSSFSRDGKKLYFASDRDAGVLDIYCLDLETRDLGRLTRVIGAAINPVTVPTRDGERIVFQGYSKGLWQLFLADPAEAKSAGKEEAPKEVLERAPYVPAVSVAIDPKKVEQLKKRKLQLDYVDFLVGVNSDSTIISQTMLSFADHYGDRRLDVVFDSIDEYSNFRFTYYNIGKRLQWGITAFDDRAYYSTQDQFSPNRRIRQAYRTTGLQAFTIYPLSTYHRVEGGIAYLDRSAAYPMAGPDNRLTFIEVSDRFPYIDAGLIGDKTFFERYGPHAGRRYQLRWSYSPDLKKGGTLTHSVMLDARQYIPLTKRTEFALRLFASASNGKPAALTYFGGLDDMRGYDYASLAGNRAAYANIEWRFPLIDYLILPWLHMSDIRGRVFVDLAAAWFDLDAYDYEINNQTIQVPAYRQKFQFAHKGRLKNGVAAYGVGFSINLFGLPAHWDFAKRWDFKQTLDKGYRTTFWIGYRF